MKDRWENRAFAGWHVFHKLAFFIRMSVCHQQLHTSHHRRNDHSRDLRTIGVAALRLERAQYQL